MFVLSLIMYSALFKVLMGCESVLDVLGFFWLLFFVCLSQRAMIPLESQGASYLIRLGQLFTPDPEFSSLFDVTHSCQLLMVNASISYR